MTADYLLIDIGNGRTKFGLATRDAILDRRDHPTPGITAEDVLRVVAGWNFDRAVLCSVVPAAVAAFREALAAKLIELKYDTPMGIGIRYPHPETIGADRLANAVALAHLPEQQGQMLAGPRDLGAITGDGMFECGGEGIWRHGFSQAISRAGRRG